MANNTISRVIAAALLAPEKTASSAIRRRLAQALFGNVLPQDVFDTVSDRSAPGLDESTQDLQRRLFYNLIRAKMIYVERRLLIAVAIVAIVAAAAIAPTLLHHAAPLVQTPRPFSF